MAEINRALQFVFDHPKETILMAMDRRLPTKHQGPLIYHTFPLDNVHLFAGMQFDAIFIENVDSWKSEQLAFLESRVRRPIPTDSRFS